MNVAALARRGTVLAAKRTPAALALAAAMKRPAKAKRPPAKPVAPPWPIVDSLRISMPLPPSVNGLHANVAGRGRVRSARYRQWLHDAGWVVKAAKPGRVVGSFTFTLYVPNCVRSDCSNRIKAAEDLCVSLGVTDDDRFCVRSCAEKSSAIPNGECLVVLKSARP